MRWTFSRRVSAQNVTATDAHRKWNDIGFIWPFENRYISHNRIRKSVIASFQTKIVDFQIKTEKNTWNINKKEI